MKKIVLSAVFFLVGLAILFANEEVINYLNASSNGNRIKIEWKTSDISSVQKYEIERSSKNHSFTKLSEVTAKANLNSYTYYDESALKQKAEELQASTLYSYRIKVVYKDNSSSYSNIVNVTHSTSGVKRTWGMIKEMFR